jgi:hypothetical protein
MAVIKIKRGTTDPTAANVTNLGELAANTSTPKLFIKTANDSATTPVWIGATIESSPSDWTSATKLATQSAINTTFMPKSGGTFTSDVSLSGGADIRFVETGGGSDYVAFQAPASIASSVTWTLPSADGSNGFFLSTNGSGTLSWASPGTATSATNLAGGAAGSVPYQTASGTTTFLADPDVAGPILTYNNSTNAPEWKAGTGTGDPVRATSPTLTTPTLGVATATSVNKVAITAPATSATLTIADGKTLTASNTLTFTGTDTSSVAFGGGGTVAYTANKLSAFAATTSSELAGVISDETGTGALVFGTSPSFTTSIATGSTTIGVFDSTATTVDAFGAATTLNLGHDGAATATTNINVATTNNKTVNIATGAAGNRFVNLATGGTAGNRTVAVLSLSSFNEDFSVVGQPVSTNILVGVNLDTNTGTVNIGTGATGTTESMNINIGTSDKGTTTVNNNLVVSGNFTVNGTTTNINTTNLVVEDKNIIIADVATPTDVTADGAGITVKGTSDKTLNWVDSTDAWTSSEHFNLLTGKAYYINGTSVLNATTLGSAVVTSSLTTVGALASGSIASGFTAINVVDLINITSLNIDAGTETTTIIGGDLLIVDDGANGTNRKVTVDNLFGSNSTATVDGGTY